MYESITCSLWLHSSFQAVASYILCMVHISNSICCPVSCFYLVRERAELQCVFPTVILNYTPLLTSSYSHQSCTWPNHRYRGFISTQPCTAVKQQMLISLPPSFVDSTVAMVTNYYAPHRWLMPNLDLIVMQWLDNRIFFPCPSLSSVSQPQY